MTTLTTYNQLKQNIQDHVKRGDVLSKLDFFIDMAEADIEKDLRIREMEATTPLTTSTSDRYVALPDGFIKARRLQIIIDGEYHDLDEQPIKTMQIHSAAGVPFQFVVTDQIELNRVSDQAYSLELTYFQMLTALSGSNQTNDILADSPMVYLSACLKHAYNWALQEQKAQYWENEYNKAVAKANRKARKGRYGPAPAMKQHKGMVV